MDEVLRINRAAKTITVRNLLDQSEYDENYDFLLLSRCRSSHPANSGIQNPLTHSLRNIPDMDKIIQTLQMNKPEHATVDGGVLSV